jgi:hypothetical protein
MPIYELSMAVGLRYLTLAIGLPGTLVAGDPDSGRTRLGLGPFIVKEIVSAHRGTITVNSTKAGGTFFRSACRG